MRAWARGQSGNSGKWLDSSYVFKPTGLMMAWTEDVRKREVNVDSSLAREAVQCELHTSSVFFAFSCCPLHPELQAPLFALSLLQGDLVPLSW